MPPAPGNKLQELYREGWVDDGILSKEEAVHVSVCYVLAMQVHVSVAGAAPWTEGPRGEAPRACPNVCGRHPPQHRRLGCKAQVVRPLIRA